MQEACQTGNDENVMQPRSVGNETAAQHSQAASAARNQHPPSNWNQKRRSRKRRKLKSVDSELLEEALANIEQENPQQKPARRAICFTCKKGFDENKQFRQHIAATKHRQESVTKPVAGPGKYVHVTGLVPGYNKDALEALMSSFGKITRKNYKSQGRVATFKYQEHSSAAAVLKFGHLDFAGRKLVVHPGWANLSKFLPVEDSFGQLVRKAADHLTETKAENQLDELERHVTDSAASREARLSTIMEDVATAVGELYPGFVVHPFGSSATGLAFVKSDVDLYMELPVPVANCVSAVAKQLRRVGPPFVGVVTVNRAKTPLVKFRHLSTGLSCDVSFKNCLGVRNTRLLSNYMDMHPRVRQLTMVVKLWAQVHGLGNGYGGISSYALVLMVVFHLQRLGLVPPVADLLAAGDNAETVDGWVCGLRPVTEPRDIDLSLSTLVKKFFSFYGSFFWERQVVCPLLGKEMARGDLINPDKLPLEMNPLKLKLAAKQSQGFQSESSRLLCVQDPFALDHNLMRGAHSGSARQLMNLMVASDNEIVNAGESQVLSRLLCARVTRKAKAMCDRLCTIGIPRPPKDEDEKVWSGRLWKILAKVLMSVLKVRVTPIVAAEKNRVVELCCHGFHSIMEGRKMAEIELLTKDENGFLKLSTVDREVAISDRILGAAVVKKLYPEAKGPDTLESKISDSLRNSLGISEDVDNESDSGDLHTKNAFAVLDGVADDDFCPEDRLEDDKNDSEKKAVGAEEANADEGLNFMKDVDFSWDSLLIDPVDRKPEVQFTVGAKRRRDRVVIMFQNNGTYGKFINGLADFIMCNLKDWITEELNTT